MQYCPNCMIQIRGRKARCPLCQREVLDAERPSVPSAPLDAGNSPDRIIADNGPEDGEAVLSKTECAERNDGDPKGDSRSEVLKNDSVSADSSQDWLDDDPFVELPSPKVSFMLMVRAVTFICISIVILSGAALVISGFTKGWLLGFMLLVLLGWVDFRVAVFYRNNLIRMLTTQGYLIMLICLMAGQWTRSGRWAVTWVIPCMFFVMTAVTFAAAKLQEMELQEFVLYPAFDVLMSLLQIIPIILGYNTFIAPAVICIALMLILVSSLVIFRGRTLREAAVKYLHM